MASNRPARVGERIREEMMDLLLRGAVKDPAVREATVSSVDVSPDLGHAKIFVRSIGEHDAKSRERLVRGFERAQSFLRRELGARLGLRTVPELRFAWDDTAERAARVEELLHEIKNEKGES